jgi:hypothetical protein
MAERCPSGFDETLITGYLDRELTQAEEQKARIHLEDCLHCGAVFRDLSRLRETTMETRFVEPTDEQWREHPRGGVSFLARGLGWLLGIVWFLAITGYGVYELWQGSENLWERLLVFGGLIAFVLLLLSVLLDRLHSLKTDRYREVQR